MRDQYSKSDVYILEAEAEESLSWYTAGSCKSQEPCRWKTVGGSRNKPLPRCLLPAEMSKSFFADFSPANVHQKKCKAVGHHDLQRDMDVFINLQYTKYKSHYYRLDNKCRVNIRIQVFVEIHL
jgi:hypothetical protein